MTCIYIWRQRFVYVYAKFLLDLEWSVAHLTVHLVGRVSLTWPSIRFRMFRKQFIKTAFVDCVNRRPLVTAEFMRGLSYR